MTHITICICTFRRPDLLWRALGAAEFQETDGGFTYSIVVADNDAAESARPTVEAFAAHARVPVAYCAEPQQNIALARNRALAQAAGEYVAWIDDDEFPGPDWLRLMLATCERFHVAGVLGPVRPHFDQPPPRWLLDGHFCERCEHPTGTAMHWSQSRTGNLLVRRAILDGIEPVFRPEFGTGGEDVDFFRRMTALGHVFVWCNEAAVSEVVPPSRWTRSYFLKRALLRGRSNVQLRHTRPVLTSLLAVPAYSLVLPGTIFCRPHVFMKYGIRFCDHLGRLLALFGLNPVKQRPM